MSRQQRWSRKQQMHTDITQAVSFLEDEGNNPSAITLVYNQTGKTESLNLELGEYSKVDIDSTESNDNPEMILCVKALWSFRYCISRAKYGVPTSAKIM